MTPKERLALALQYQRPSLGDVAPAPYQRGSLGDTVPVAGVDNAPTAGPAPLSFMDRLREGSAGAGRGLESQLEGYKQMAVHPIDSARAMGQGVVDIARDPSKIVDALKAMGEKATSGSAGMGEVLGENLSLNPRKLIEALSRPNVQELTGYHGTPHTLPPVEGSPLGKFDASKIGTGEGAQAFGHGLYFAENPKVAKGYQSQLSKTEISLDGKPYVIQLDALDPQSMGLNALTIDHDPMSAAAKLRHSASDDSVWSGYAASDQSLRPKYVAAADWLEKNANRVSAKAGNLYTVDIPDAHIERMLDFDASFKNQAQSVKDVLQAKYPSMIKRLHEFYSTDDLPMSQILHHLGNDESLARALQQAGIPGIKYFDEGSRNPSPPKTIYDVGAPKEGFGPYSPFDTAAEAEKHLSTLRRAGFPDAEIKVREIPGQRQTRNFVVFPGEEHNLTILERNGEKASPKKISEALQSMPSKTDVKSVDKYQGEHSPPGPDSGAPLHDLTGNGVYPADFYSHNQIRHYGTGDPTDSKSFAIANEMKGNPDKQVTMYRAVPVTRSNAEKIAELEAQKAAYLRRNIVPAGQPEKGFYDRASNEIERLKKLPEQEVSVPSINEGDWVTINRDYAKAHGEGALSGEYKIVTKKVKAKDLYTNGDSIHEFGYWPNDKGMK